MEVLSSEGSLVSCEGIWSRGSWYRFYGGLWQELSTTWQRGHFVGAHSANGKGLESKRVFTSITPNGEENFMRMDLQGGK